jgi:hypothetical protein
LSCARLAAFDTNAASNFSLGRTRSRCAGFACRLRPRRRDGVRAPESSRYLTVNVGRGAASPFDAVLDVQAAASLRFGDARRSRERGFWHGPRASLSAPSPDWGIPPNERLPPATDGYRPAPTNVCKGRFGRLASLDVKPSLTRTRCLYRGTDSASPWPGTGCVRAKLEPAEAAVRARTPTRALDRVGFMPCFQADARQRVMAPVGRLDRRVLHA